MGHSVIDYAMLYCHIWHCLPPACSLAPYSIFEQLKAIKHVDSLCLTSASSKKKFGKKNFFLVQTGFEPVHTVWYSLVDTELNHQTIWTAA